MSVEIQTPALTKHPSVLVHGWDLDRTTLYGYFLSLMTFVIHLLKIVDTPGFGDSSGKDNQYIQEMMDILDNKLGYAHTIVLVLEGSTPRFSSGLEDMLKQMSSIFGETWWEFMMIGRFCLSY